MHSSKNAFNILISVIFALICNSVCIRRDYYVGTEEVWWDYAPSKQNLVTNDRSFSDAIIQTKEDRIGSVYRKVMLNQFTDGSFRREIKPPPWMGYVGPLLRGETGDVMYVHFRNMASRPYSLHPHGVQYFKNGEGAFYLDGTRGRDKLDDMVQPGTTYTYKWFLTKTFAPTEDDDNCIPLGYHPHVRSHKDIDTGLIGMIIVCKPGTLRADGSRKDVDREFVLYADVVNETNSWLIEESLKRCGNPDRCRQLFNEKNPQFVADTNFYQINGYVYGNLPDFPVYEGERVVFYSLGLNLGIHIIAVQGQTLMVKDRRFHGYPFGIAMFEGLYMTPRNPGRWLMWCKVAYHFNHGMAAFLNVMPSRNPRLPPVGISGHTRRYYIAAEEVIWDYRPSGRVLARVGKGSESRSRGEERFFTNDGAVGGRFVKAIFREYTDATFTTPKRRSYEEVHLGIVGPPIKVEVGDNLQVVFMNKASRPYSFNPFGLAFTKDNEGALYKNKRYSNRMTGAVAMPGEVKTYFFNVPEDYGPTKIDPQCITSTYQSFVDFSRDMYSGLVGPLLICKRGSLDGYGRQRGVDKEFYVMMMTWFEQDSWYFNQSIALAMSNGKKVDQENDLFRDANSLRAINGRVYGNIGGFDMCVGDKVSWHMIGFGERFDSHAAIFEGNNVLHDSRMVHFVSVLPGISQTAYMIPDNPGKWLLHSGQLGAQNDGMVTTYNVGTCQRPQITFVPSNERYTVRRMYIAAVEVDWEYAPRKLNTMTLTDLRNPDTPGHLYIRNDDKFIGSKFKKAVYREFYDSSFTLEVPRKKKDLHLGILGPFIRAEVGDVIEIVFKNMASFDNSISLRNLREDNEMSKRQKNGVKTGEIHVYRWKVPYRSGPGKNEPNCVGYSYKSPVFPNRDTATGLLGPLVICRKGTLDAFGNRKDHIDKEFALAYVVFNETNSHYFDENVQRRAPNRMDLTDSIFQASNLKFSINGFIFQNIPYLVMKEGDQVAWYTYSFGSLFGAHSNHFHGQTFIRSTKLSLRNDVVGVIPGTSETVEMLTDNPGTWFVHCHVGSHMASGMLGVYTVVPRNPMNPAQNRKQIELTFGAKTRRQQQTFRAKARRQQRIFGAKTKHLQRTSGAKAQGLQRIRQYK